MNKKIVALISEDTELEDICKRIDQRKQFAEKKIKDFEKLLKEAHDSLQKDNESDWVILTEWLRGKNRLPSDYNEQTHNISFNLKNNGVAVARLDSEIDMPQIKNMGAFPIDALPPDLQKAMMEIIQNMTKRE